MRFDYRTGCPLLAACDRLIAAANAALARAGEEREAILGTVIDAVADARPAIWVGSLITEDPSVMRVIGHAGTNPLIADYLDRLERRGGLSPAPVSARVIESREALLLPSIHLPEFLQHYFTDAPVIEHLAAAKPARLSALIVPMRAGRAVVGTLGMYVAASEDSINEDEAASVQAIADLTAWVIENARLRHESKLRLEMVADLDELVRVVASTHDLSAVIKRIVNRVTRTMGIGACDVLLVNEADETFVLAESAGFKSTIGPGLRLNAGNALLRQALDSQRVEYLRSVAVLDHASRRALFVHEGFVAYAAFPIVSRGALVGALEVFHRSHLRLDAEGRAFISCLAGLTAVAVETS